MRELTDGATAIVRAALAAVVGRAGLFPTSAFDRAFDLEPPDRATACRRAVATGPAAGSAAEPNPTAKPRPAIASPAAPGGDP